MIRVTGPFGVRLRINHRIKGILRMKSFILSFALALAIPTAGMAQSPQSGGLQLGASTVEKIYIVARDYIVAEQIVRQCGSQFRMKRGAKRQTSAYLQNLARKEGVPDALVMYQFRQRISPARVQTDMINYVQKSGIILSDRRTWCAAGQKEVRTGSRIGNFMKRR